ncbi:MAG: hypothetical protein HYU71_03605 [Bacteroidetes bacterium]|nr:hypothetical protein [Bacteroidota bacterium]
MEREFFISNVFPVFYVASRYAVQVSDTTPLPKVDKLVIETIHKKLCNIANPNSC